jgi:hypothetical protein
MQRKRMPDYLKRAKKRFLQGLWHTSPVDAVLAGKRTLEEWVDIVAQEHDLEMQNQTTAPCTMVDAKRQTWATNGSRNRQRFS